MKTRTQCCEQKNETEFYMNGKILHAWCKTCFSAKTRIFRQKHLIRMRRYDQTRSWQRKGILNEQGNDFLLEDFDRIYQIQQGRCKICKKHSTEFKRNLAVDHNHETGIVRGLLCLNCNRGLGSFQEEKNLLKEAIKYLNQ
jgi:Recombination endonuclease VII